MLGGRRRKKISEALASEQRKTLLVLARNNCEQLTLDRLLQHGECVNSETCESICDLLMYVWCHHDVAAECASACPNLRLFSLIPSFNTNNPHHCYYKKTFQLTSQSWLKLAQEVSCCWLHVSQHVKTKTCYSPFDDCACERVTIPTADAAPLDAMKHQNYERAEQGLNIILQELAIYAKGNIKAYHTSLLAKETTAADGTSRITLGELPACTRHTRTPEDKTKGPSINELLACPSCKPWIETLGAAHESKKPKRINVRQPHTPIIETGFTDIIERFCRPPTCILAHGETLHVAHGS